MHLEWHLAVRPVGPVITRSFWTCPSRNVEGYTSHHGGKTYWAIGHAHVIMKFPSFPRVNFKISQLQSQDHDHACRFAVSGATVFLEVYVQLLVQCTYFLLGIVTLSRSHLQAPATKYKLEWQRRLQKSAGAFICQAEAKISLQDYQGADADCAEALKRPSTGTGPSK